MQAQFQQKMRGGQQRISDPSVETTTPGTILQSIWFDRPRLPLSAGRIQVPLDRRYDFRRKTGPFGHFVQKSAKIGVRNR
jgi:hypothetical protein